MQVNPITQLYNDFIRILDKSVIKYKSKADEYETVETKKSSDAYIRACLGEDKFETYYRYERDIIAEILILSNDREIDTYYYDRDKIPLKYRDAILNRQRQYIKDTYVESNNYYRCLNGLPDVEDCEADFIYLDEETTNKYGLPRYEDSNGYLYTKSDGETYRITDLSGKYIGQVSVEDIPFDVKPIPIHKFTNNQIDTLDSVGYIDILISKYPIKSYLKFLGNMKIDIITARRAMNFGLLRVPYDITESLLNLFMMIYEQCREYFMTCIYVKEYRSTIDYYDNFIAMCIMVMAIQQVIARTIKSTIERDFFDTYCCKLLFSVYGVPFYSEMDTATRTQLVQNLNMLVQNKGTNKVIYDIAAILGYDRLEIFKYYIVKAQKFDDNGLPIYVTRKDPDTGEDVPDYKSMFDVYFQKVSISDDDAYNSVINSADKQTYLEVTENDPYWIDDAELQKELYESEYNFVESKYMGVGISYRMTKILFENIYLMKMLLEKKDQISNIIIDIPKMSTYSTISLFDAIVVLCAMVCKQNRLKGEILTDPSKILHVLGFTFDEDWNVISTDIVETKKCEQDIMGFNFSKTTLEIQNEIKNNKYLDDTLCDFFTDSASYTAASINTLYKNYANLYDVLVEKMSTTDDINVYHAYKKLYQAFYFTKENDKMFNIGTDTSGEPMYAKTYMDYLKVKVPDMYNFINDTGPDNMYSNVNYIVSRIMSIMPDLKYLGFFDGHSNTMEKMLIELIQFFKSYTTDLINMNIIYIFDVKPETLIRLIGYAEIHGNIIPRDYLNISYSDHLNFISTVKYGSNLNIKDSIALIENTLTLFDSCRFIDYISSIHNEVAVNDKHTYHDALDKLWTRINCETGFSLSDNSLISSYPRAYDNICAIRFRDLIKNVIKVMMEDHISLKDAVYVTIESMVGDRLQMNDCINASISKNYAESSISLNDRCTTPNINMCMIDLTPSLTDIIDSVNDKIRTSSELSFRDNCKISYSN